MTRRRSLVALTLLGAGIAVLLMSRSASTPAAPEATGVLEVSAPDRHPAGEALAIDVSGASHDLTALDVMVDGTAGTRQLTVPVADGSARLVLDETATATSGVLSVWVVAGADAAEALVLIEPGRPVSPVVPLVGPKSIVADGTDHSMVVALATDAFGNAVPERQDLAVTAIRADGVRETGGVEVTGLIGWSRVVSGTLAGRTEISVGVGLAEGPTADLDEVAGPPVAITLRRGDADQAPLLADGRRLHELVSDPLVDRFGNVVVDGTAVTVRLDEPSGRRTATVPTIDGRAQLHLEAPNAPGTVRVVVSSSGVDSAPLDLRFEPAVKAIPTRVSRIGGSWVVEVGPVRTIDGGWVPEGTVVELGGGETARTVDGMATFERVTPPASGETVTLLGVEAKLT